MNKQYDDLNDGLRRMAGAIAADAAPGTDAQGGTITSLTESVMGVTAALTEIAGENSDTTMEVVRALDGIAKAIHENFTSVNVPDSNLEPANVVDGIDKVAGGLFAIAKAIEGGAKHEC